MLIDTYDLYTNKYDIRYVNIVLDLYIGKRDINSYFTVDLTHLATHSLCICISFKSVIRLQLMGSTVYMITSDVIAQGRSQEYVEGGA